MAGAFLLAGFPSVVGTLWHINDERSAEVSANFYRDIVQNSGSIETKRAA